MFIVAELSGDRHRTATESKVYCLANYRENVLTHDLMGTVLVAEKKV